MARKTAAERREEKQRLLELAQAEELARQLLEWPARMMELLSCSMDEGFNLKHDSVGLTFTVSWMDHHGWYSQVIPLYPKTIDEMDMWSLEWQLDKRKIQREESARRAKVRETALAKLTSEEKEELGLK